MIKISFIVSPPIWPNLPPLGLAYLLSNIQKKIKNIEIKSEIIDINIELFNYLKKNNLYTEITKNWTMGDYKASNKILENFDNFKNSGFDIISSLREKVSDSDIIGFTIFSSNLNTSIYIATFLKKYSNKHNNNKKKHKENKNGKNLKLNNFYKHKKQLFIAGGPEITLSYLSETLNKFDIFDFLFVGESEETINIFLNNYISFLNKKNLIKSFFKSNRIYNGYIFKKQIDEINIPCYDKFELNKYIRKNALPILSSRGCIGKCKFCTEKLLYKHIKIRKPEYIFNEIKYYYNKYGIKWFTFYDSMINASLKTLKTWMKLIIKENIKIYWDAQILIRNDMDDETFKLIKESGNIDLFIGLESGSDTVLKKMGKFFNTNDAIMFFKKLNNYDIFFEISLIAGYPGETEDEFNQTLQFLEKYKNLINKIGQINKFILYDALDNSLKKIISSNRDYEKISNVRFEKLKNHIIKHGYKYTEKYIGNLM